MSAVPDENYYLKDDFVTFQVESTLFRVPRYPFIDGSEVFRTMFQLPQDKSKASDGQGDTIPIQLPGITVHDFRALLRVLCPRGYARHQSITFDEWSSVLRLCSLWMFDDIRTLAINSIDEILAENTQPIQTIRLGKEFKIARWLQRGYSELITRETTLSDNDVESIGWTSAAQVFRSREHYRLLLVQSNVLCNCGRENGALECLSCRHQFDLKELALKKSRLGQTDFNLDEHVRTSFAHELGALGVSE